MSKPNKGQKPKKPRFKQPTTRRRKGLGASGVCRDCKLQSPVPRNEWSHARGPRCPACGGGMDNVNHLHNEAMTAKGIYK